VPSTQAASIKPLPSAALAVPARASLEVPTRVFTGSSPSSVSSAYSSEVDPTEVLELGDDDENVEDGTALSQKYLYHRYVGVLDKALAERATVGVGSSPLIHSLYTFWVGRLTHKFNRNMYRTFVRLALEDHSAGDRTGVCLCCVCVCVCVFLNPLPFSLLSHWTMRSLPGRPGCSVSLLLL
jgi:hypothetical protein